MASSPRSSAWLGDVVLAVRASVRCVLDDRPHMTIGRDTTHGDRVLAGLDRQDGIQLLRQHGVRSGDDAALGQVVEYYAGQAAGYPVWRREVNRLAENVTQHQALLREVGVDIPR